MDLGILLSWFNQRYFRDHLSMWCEFVPQMIFLNGLFGYLCLLILIKWISGSTADIYHILIYMFLSPGKNGLTCNGDCKENQMFSGQGVLQVRLGFHAARNSDHIFPSRGDKVSGSSKRIKRCLGALQLILVVVSELSSDQMLFLAVQDVFCNALSPKNNLQNENLSRPKLCSNLRVSAVYQP